MVSFFEGSEFVCDVLVKCVTVVAVTVMSVCDGSE